MPQPVVPKVRSSIVFATIKTVSNTNAATVKKAPSPVYGVHIWDTVIIT